MRNSHYSRKLREQIRKTIEAFCPDSSTLNRVQTMDRVLTSVVKTLIWLGYGIALVSWFVAANGVIVFSRVLKSR
jgi:hypothetical protein